MALLRRPVAEVPEVQRGVRERVRPDDPPLAELVPPVHQLLLQWVAVHA